MRVRLPRSKLTKEQRAKNKAACDKKLREKRKLLGFCARCGKHPAAEDYDSCFFCRKKVNKRAAEFYRTNRTAIRLKRALKKQEKEGKSCLLSESDTRQDRERTS